MKQWRALTLFALFACSLQATSVVFERYDANGWAEGLNVPAQTDVELKPTEFPGLANLLLRFDALRVSVARRKGYHEEWLALNGLTEEDSLDSQIRFVLRWNTQRYPFDATGAPVVDLRFVKTEERDLVDRVQKLYLALLEDATPEVRKCALIERPTAAGAADVPVFQGFEDDRYQMHDALILQLVKEFNEHPEDWVGAAEGDRVNLPPLRPELVKALMIEESGGSDARSREAWKVDPLQVNVPGDWAEAKTELGLSQPQNRNEGTLEGNMRAGIMWLARKGYGRSGKGIAHRPGAYFDSWRIALQRYNGRLERLPEQRFFRTAYADRILRRANHPERFVPIARETSGAK